MVGGKLHNERSGIACEHLGLLKDNTGNNDCRNTYNIGAPADHCAVSEQSACDQTNDRKLRSAGNEGCGHDRHAAVSFILDGTGSHNTGNAAACAYHHGDERLTGQTESSENTVHDKCDPRHIAAALKEGQANEQNDHLRQESEDSTDTGDDTIENQAAEPVCRSDTLKEAAHCSGNDLAEQYIIYPVSSHGADRIDRQVIYQEHNQPENR